MKNNVNSKQSQPSVIYSSVLSSHFFFLGTLFLSCTCAGFGTGIRLRQLILCRSFLDSLDNSFFASFSSFPINVPLIFLKEMLAEHCCRFLSYFEMVRKPFTGTIITYHTTPVMVIKGAHKTICVGKWRHASISSFTHDRQQT